MVEILLISVLIDLIIADPFWLYHPVQFIGLVSVYLEKYLRKIKFISLYVLGAIHWLLIVAFFVGLFLIIEKSLSFNSLFLSLFYIYITYSLLAIGSLTREARVIYNYLKKNELQKARSRVQGIVSRDMSNADEHQITRATIETVTENLSDGIIAPLFFYLIGGPIGIIVYKVVNTLDSMIAYKNDKYLKYGWFSAKADDLFNYIPARLTGLVLVLIALIRRDSISGALTAWKRDAQKGPSPNGGIPIVVYAGARNIKLGGPCQDKDGNIIKIPFVGGTNSFDREEIKTTISYTYTASAIMIIAIVLISKI